MFRARLACLALLAFGTTVLAQDANEEFKNFVATYLGARKEPLRYTYSGETLQFLPESEWTHISENSVAIAFETSLPSRSYVEYGTSSSFGQRTATTDRFTSLHLHHLQGLLSGQKVYYRTVAEDERGIILRGAAKEATPSPIAGAKYIPGDLSEPPPYVITQGGYYVLTDDIVSPTRGVTFKADDITLDLNGHKILYDTGTPLVTGEWNDYVYSDISTFGVKTGYDKWRILNGVIEQDPRSTHGGHVGYGFNPIYGSGGPNAEVAGVVARWSGPNTGGIICRYGNTHIHHNLVEDRGAVLTDRHLGLKAIEGEKGKASYNLVLRARHIGISGHQDVVGNEIYIDSYATNAFAIGTKKNATLNKILGTGYHVLGVGWADKLSFTKNFIHLVAHKQFDRSDEYGIHCSVNGIRLTQYSGSTNKLEGMRYENNVVSVAAIGACSQARGIQLASDTYFKDIVVSNNIFRATLLDPDAPNPKVELAAIVAHGLSDRISTTNPILYFDNTLMSNWRFFNFGDSYSVGSKHYFVRSTLIREGKVANFYPIGIGFWKNSSLDNRLLSTKSVGEFSLENGYFQGSGAALQEYSVGAAINLKAQNCAGEPLLGVTFTVTDSRGSVQQGTTDPTSGAVLVHALEYTMVGSTTSRTGTKVLHESPILLLNGYAPLTLTKEVITGGSSPQYPLVLRFPRAGSEVCAGANAPSPPRSLRLGP